MTEQNGFAMPRDNVAIIYSRFSPRPRADECDSIEKQDERGKAYCGMRGLEPRYCIADPDTSGYSVPMDERDGGKRVLRLLETKKASHLVTANVSRLFRDTADGVETVRKWAKAGISLHLVDEGGNSIDVSTPMGKFVFTMLLAKAELERDQIAYNTSRAMRAHQKRGRRQSDHVPYGMMVDKKGPKHAKSGLPNRLIENPAEQIAINRIRQMAGSVEYQDAKGRPRIRKIAAQLNAEGHRARTKTGWTHVAVLRILRRENPAPDCFHREPAGP